MTELEKAMRPLVERAEYRFDVAIAELLGLPRPESPEERARREMRESFAAIGRTFGDLGRVYIDARKALVNGFASAFASTEEGWRDRHGDVWTEGADGLMYTPETAPFPREHVEKKWGPLVPVSGDSE